MGLDFSCGAGLLHMLPWALLGAEPGGGLWCQPWEGGRLAVTCTSNASAAKQHLAPHSLLPAAFEASASCSLAARSPQLPCTDSCQPRSGL